MSYRAEPKGSMKAYLQQRSAEDAVAAAAVANDRHKRSAAWLEKYHARSRKTAFNWSPSITVTKTEETTSEAKVHHEEGHHAQAAEVGIAEGVGNAPGEEGKPELAADRFARPAHTDFGDGDTPF